MQLPQLLSSFPASSKFPLLFHVNVRISFIVSWKTNKKKSSGISAGIAWNLQVSFRRINITKVLSLPLHGLSVFLHTSSLISFISFFLPGIVRTLY